MQFLLYAGAALALATPALVPGQGRSPPRSDMAERYRPTPNDTTFYGDHVARGDRAERARARKAKREAARRASDGSGASTRHDVSPDDRPVTGNAAAPR